MLSTDTPVTKQDFDESGWRDLMTACGEKTVEAYRDIFQNEALKAEKLNNAKRMTVFTLLMDAASPVFHNGDSDEPFMPLSRFNGKRSALPEDFEPTHLDLFAALLPDVLDVEMRARLADILWLRLRDHRYIGEAVTAYLESAQRLVAPAWYLARDRIRRATQLAILQGQEGEPYKKTMELIDQLLAQNYVGNDTNFPLTLLQLQIEQGAGDLSRGIVLADDYAKKAEQQQNWHQAREYHELAASIRRRNKDESGAQMSMREAAETHIKLAELELAGPQKSNLNASIHYRSAFEAFQRLGDKARADEIKRILLPVQEKSVSEMQSVQVSIDTKPIQDMSDKARDHVKGQSFREAILHLTFISGIQTIEKLRKRAEEQSKTAPLVHLISATYVNRQGRVTARRPSSITSDPDEREEAIRSEMLSLAALSHDISGSTLIEPARAQINLDNPASVADFLQIIKNSPFIPEARTQIYAEGLLAGLRGKWVESVHLLIPQFENSIRYVLYKQGVIASGYDQEGIQDEFDLNKTLYMPETKAFLGEDLAFDLQSLLISPHGSNLRNLICHGLMDQAEIQHSFRVPYFWWTTLRMILLPMIALPEESQGSEDAPPPKTLDKPPAGDHT